MARLLNATGYVSSVLATVCLILALIAAPIGEARADEPEGNGAKAPDPCRINDNNPAGCPGIICVNGTFITCRYNLICACPQ